MNTTNLRNRKSILRLSNTRKSTKLYPSLIEHYIRASRSFQFNTTFYIKKIIDWNSDTFLIQHITITSKHKSIKSLQYTLFNQNNHLHIILIENYFGISKSIQLNTTIHIHKKENSIETLRLLNFQHITTTLNIQFNQIPTIIILYSTKQSYIIFHWKLHQNHKIFTI